MKAAKLNQGDQIAIVSLSSGILGEAYAAHEVELATIRLQNYGFNVKFMPNALKGLDYLQQHPEARAADLLTAFADPDVQAIICAIGGDDTFRLAPYLFAKGELPAAVAQNPKIFLGFSDTTINHLMLAKCGLNTFYGQAFLPDIAELDLEMLPYSKSYLEQLLVDGSMSEIVPSNVWYEERTRFDPDQLGVPRIPHNDSRGFEVIQGSGLFSGTILGGCIESLYDMLAGDTHPEEPAIISEYDLFPGQADWAGKILLLETAETQSEPAVLRRMLEHLKETGIFEVVSGILVGKPMDEKYYEEYKSVYQDVIANPDLSIVYNLNAGHALPRCIIPFGVQVEVNGPDNRIFIVEDILK